MKIVFATNTTRQASEVLNHVGADVRLLSFWYLKTLPPTFLEQYVENGIGPARKEKTNGNKTKRVQLITDGTAGGTERREGSNRTGLVRPRPLTLLPDR